MERNSKKRYIIALSGLFAIIIAGLYFFQFSPFGYCITIRVRDFAEIDNNVFVNNSYSHITVNDNGEYTTKDDIPVIVNEARNRVSELFGGEILSDPVIIVSDNPKTYSITGEAITWSLSLHKVFSYISISHSNLSIDIVAHELTHAELAYRILNGKPFRIIDSFIPIWFNEGLASISDNRSIFSKETWNIRTDNGTNTDIDVTKLTRADFHAGNANGFIAQEYALFARNEVLSWLEMRKWIRALQSLAYSCSCRPISIFILLGFSDYCLFFMRLPWRY